MSMICCDAVRLDEGMADDHLGRVAAFGLDDVELLDARVGDGVVHRVGVGVDAAAGGLLGAAGGTDQPVLGLMRRPFGPIGLGFGSTLSWPVAILIAPALMPVLKPANTMPSVRSRT